MKGPKNGVIKASFKDCPISDRETFPSSHGMLLISVGQSYHEDQKLQATIELVNRKFASCTILVCDTLQRYNILMERPKMSMQDAYVKSLLLGDEWLERNKSIYSKFKIPYNVVRWDSWLNDLEFDSKQKIIQELYTNNQAYKEAIQASLKEYLYRRQRSNPNIVLTDAATHCLNYLLEECAAMLLWVNEGYNFEIYPCRRNLAMSVTHEKLIAPFAANILKPVAIRFKRYAQNNTEISKITEAKISLGDEINSYA